VGTITARKRSDHSTGYTAQIRLKEAGKVVYSESRTFDRKQAANAWLKKRETELAENGPPGASTVLDPTLAEVIAQSKQFIGNQSVSLSLAIGLGVNWACEARDDIPPERNECYFPNHPNGEYF
jgi:hypothetical protein